MGNLKHVERTPEYQLANAGFVFDYQLIDVGDYNGVGESAPSPYFYQVWMRLLVSLWHLKIFIVFAEFGRSRIRGRLVHVHANSGISSGEDLDSNDLQRTETFASRRYRTEMRQ